MKFFLCLIFSTVLFSDYSRAAEPSPLISAFAKANGTNLENFDCEDMKISSYSKGYDLSFNRAPGEGTESCKGKYRKDGSLKQFTCEFEHSSESMGPENAKTRVKATRYYNNTGTMTKASGHVKVIRVADKTIKEDRAINSTTDEHLKDLTVPVLKLNSEIMNKVLGPK